MKYKDVTKTCGLGLRITKEFKTQLLEAKKTYEAEQGLECSLAKFIIKILLENPRLHVSKNPQN